MDFRKGLIPSPPDSRDYVLKAMVKPLRIPTPDECYQWLQWATPVKYQADSDCAAFTGNAVAELYNTKEFEKPIDLSEQFLYGEAKKIDGIPEEKGTYLRAILSVLKNTGVCEEFYLPYEGRYPPQGKMYEGGYENAQIYKILSYATVSTDKNSMKQAIFQTGPVLAGIMVWESFEKTGEDGIVTMPIGKQLGGHAIAIVGYDSIGFIAKNSWSPYWGKDGYCTIPYDIWDIINLKEAWSIVDIVGKPKKTCFLVRWVRKLRKDK